MKKIQIDSIRFNKIQIKSGFNHYITAPVTVSVTTASIGPVFTAVVAQVSTGPVYTAVVAQVSTGPVFTAVVAQVYLLFQVTTELQLAKIGEKGIWKARKEKTRRSKRANTGGRHSASSARKYAK